MGRVWWGDGCGVAGARGRVGVPRWQLGQRPARWTRLQGSRGFWLTANDTDPSIPILCASAPPRLCVDPPPAHPPSPRCVGHRPCGRLPFAPSHPCVFALSGCLPGRAVSRSATNDTPPPVYPPLLCALCGENRLPGPRRAPGHRRRHQLPARPPPRPCCCSSLRLCVRNQFNEAWAVYPLPFSVSSCASVVNPAFKATAIAEPTARDAASLVIPPSAPPPLRNSALNPYPCTHPLPRRVGRLTGWPDSPCVVFVVFVVLPRGMSRRLWSTGPAGGCQDSMRPRLPPDPVHPVRQAPSASWRSASGSPPSARRCHGWHRTRVQPRSPLRPGSRQTWGGGRWPDR